MKYVFAMLALATFVFFQNCAPQHQTIDLNSSDINAFSTQSIAIYEQTLYPLVQTNCASCHGVNQQPVFALDVEDSHQQLSSLSLISKTNPGSSALLVKIESGHQGFSMQLADDFNAQIMNWINQLDKLDSALEN